MTPIYEDYPFPDALCVFYATKGTMFLGYMPYGTASKIKVYGKPEIVEVSIATVTHYQYVLNPGGGVYFITKKHDEYAEVLNAEK